MSLEPPQDILSHLAEAFAPLPKDAVIGVAVSGGSDSVALLLALRAAMPQAHLCAATVDHGLRAEAKEEALWVNALCGKLGVAHTTLTISDLPKGPNLQARARSARYEALALLSASIQKTRSTLMRNPNIFSFTLSVLKTLSFNLFSSRMKTKSTKTAFLLFTSLNRSFQHSQCRSKASRSKIKHSKWRKLKESTNLVSQSSERTSSSHQKFSSSASLKKLTSFQASIRPSQFE